MASCHSSGAWINPLKQVGFKLLNTLDSSWPINLSDHFASGLEEIKARNPSLRIV
jgi:hypothetical protein